MASMKVGDLRKLLAESNAGWTVQAHLSDSDPIPRYALGANPPKGLPSAAQVGKVDLSPYLSTPSANPYL
jgi:hypothetical protein